MEFIHDEDNDPMTSQSQIAYELYRDANEMRVVGQALQQDARAGLFKQAGLNVEAMADVALKVALEVEMARKKAVAGTFTAVDIESIAVAVDPLLNALHSVANLMQLSGTQLGDIIRDAESQQEAIRNKRQMNTTAFQSFDQKSNQLMAMLSSIIKALSEMRAIGSGSRTGL